MQVLKKLFSWGRFLFFAILMAPLPVWYVIVYRAELFRLAFPDPVTAGVELFALWLFFTVLLAFISLFGMLAVEMLLDRLRVEEGGPTIKVPLLYAAILWAVLLALTPPWGSWQATPQKPRYDFATGKLLQSGSVPRGMLRVRTVNFANIVRAAEQPITTSDLYPLAAYPKVNTKALLAILQNGGQVPELTLIKLNGKIKSEREKLYALIDFAIRRNPTLMRSMHWELPKELVPALFVSVPVSLNVNQKEGGAK